MSKFKPPKITLGERVLYHRHGEKTHIKPQVAFVTEVGEQNISIFLPIARQSKSGVFHLDDPRLQSVELRVDGAWEHTEFRMDHDKLLKRVESLEEAMNTIMAGAVELDVTDLD